MGEGSSPSTIIIDNDGNPNEGSLPPTIIIDNDGVPNSPIMDEDIPNSSWSRSEIIKWLKANGVDTIGSYKTKSSLLSLIEGTSGPDAYDVSEIFDWKSFGIGFGIPTFCLIVIVIASRVTAGGLFLPVLSFALISILLLFTYAMGNGNKAMLSGVTYATLLSLVVIWPR